MKRTMLKDEVNRFIAANFEKQPAELSKMIKEQFGDDLNRDLVRKRKNRLKKTYGANLENINKFAEDLEANGFDPHNWKHGWLKTDKTSIFVKNNEDLVSYEDIRDELIASLKKHSPKYPKIKRKVIKEGHLLEINPADIHLGKLAMLAETGDEYNIEIAKKRCIEGVMGIVEKANGFPIEKINLIVGNDILHIDTPRRQTTAGTPQDTDKQWWFAYIHARQMYVSIIEHLMTVADVHVVYCPSNHDYMSGFMLADSLASWFHNSKNVSFDVTIKHRKFYQYGLNMIMYDHGDGHKLEQTPLTMANDEPKMWAATKYRYSRKHHLHHYKRHQWQSGKDYIGVTVIFMRSVSGTDGWHDRNGYVGVHKAVEGFVLSKDKGQIAHLTHYF